MNSTELSGVPDIGVIKAYVLNTQRHSTVIQITCVVLCLMNVNQKELLFQSEVWL